MHVKPDGDRWRAGEKTSITLSMDAHTILVLACTGGVGELIHQCLLIFGHLSYSAESPVGQRLRDVIGLEIGDGTAQAFKLVIARNLPGREYARWPERNRSWEGSTTRSRS